MKRPYKIIKFVNKIKFYKRLAENAWDERYEFDNDVSGNYTPRQFLFGLFKAVLLNKVCWNCNGHGMTGYYEPEACGHCEGFGFNWQNEPEPDWAAMAEGMREFDQKDQQEM